MKNQMKFYLAIFLRRLHYFLLVFVLVSAASFTLARLLPAVYESQARLLVESAQIPKELAAATVNTGASEQLQIIEQRLLTRANMLEIARRLGVFEDSGQKSADQIVSDMRNKTTIRRSGGRNQATFMTISFAGRSGSIAANVTNEFVTMILQDNAKIRAGRAGDTLDFFEQEVERLGVELQEQSAAILSFKSSNADALPETLSYRLGEQTRLIGRIESAERDMANFREQKIRLTQIFEATGGLGPTSNLNQTPEQIQLARLQDELNGALSVYSPENPKIKLLQAQITQLENKVASQSGAAVATSEGAPSILDINLADIDARIGVLQQQSAQAQSQLQGLASTIERTPANAIAIDALERDYQNLQSQYNTAVDRLAKAATGERIELLSKGQRIAILEAASVPNEPTKPNRQMIAFGGTALGAVLGLSIVVLLELLNSAIRRPADITKNIGITPIATIPYIRTPMELVVRRAVLVAVFALIAFGVPALLYAVHIYYLPLDLIYDRVAGKFGAFL